MKKITEKEVHTAVCKYLDAQYPDVIYLSDPSGMRVTIGLQMELKRKRCKRYKIPDTEQIVFKIVNTEQGPTMYLVGNISQDLYNSVTNSYIKTKAGQSNFPQKKLTEYVNFNDND